MCVIRREAYHVFNDETKACAMVNFLTQMNAEVQIIESCDTYEQKI